MELKKFIATTIYEYLNEQQTLNEMTLYHGTIIDKIPSINQNGLMPTIGDFVKNMYAGSVDGDVMDYLEEILYATDKKQLDKARTAIVYQIANKLGKDYHSITNEEFEKYGALAVVKNGDEYFDFYSEEDRYYGRAPLGVESGDYYTRNVITPDYILTGKKLISFFRKFNLYPIKSNINEKYSKGNLSAIRDFYPEYYHNAKNNSEIVGWSSKKEQNKRFEVLLNIGFENGETVLDFGCGLGALYEYMNKKYDDFKYIGVDINQEFIDKCKKKYPKIMFKHINNITDIKYRYDWFIASGAFTVYTLINDMIKTIKNAFKQVKYGIAINFLESAHAKDSDLVAIRGYNKKELYEMFLQEFKEFHTVELHDDYVENDFTIYIKKIEYFK